MNFSPFMSPFQRLALTSSPLCLMPGGTHPVPAWPHRPRPGRPILTAVLTPRRLLNQPQRLMVPLYQRRYVWEETEQWQPLWDDIVRIAQLRQDGVDATHFLGATVLQCQMRAAGSLETQEVVDGQQRLTTLQLAFDAVAGALATAGHDRLVTQLTKLTHNDPDEIHDPVDSLKFQHRNQDGVAFFEVMQAQAPVDHAQLAASGGRIARAHEFSTQAAHDHLAADEGGDHARALVDALREGLQLVVITLTRPRTRRSSSRRSTPGAHR